MNDGSRISNRETASRFMISEICARNTNHKIVRNISFRKKNISMYAAIRKLKKKARDRLTRFRRELYGLWNSRSK